MNEKTKKRKKNAGQQGNTRGGGGKRLRGVTYIGLEFIVTKGLAESAVHLFRYAAMIALVV